MAATEAAILRLMQPHLGRRPGGLGELAAVTLLGCITAISAVATQSEPTFRANTTLVELEIVALDDRGRPVTDLRREELVLTEGNQRREISFFRFNRGGVAQNTLALLAPGYISNLPDAESQSPFPGFTAILFDLLNTAPPDQLTGRNQLATYLTGLPPNTRVALFRFAENEPVRLVHPFTDRPQEIRARLTEFRAATRRELVVPGHRQAPIVGADCFINSVGSSQEEATNRRVSGPKDVTLGILDESQDLRGRRDPGREIGDARGAAGAALAHQDMNRQIRDARLTQTLASLESVGNYLAGIPGRKNIVWVTSGMPLMLSGLGKNYEPQLRLTAQRMASQGIAVYPVDAKGLCRQGDSSTNEGSFGFHDAPPAVFATLEAVAAITGGRVLRNTNDPTTALKAAADDNRGEYALGFYTDDEMRRSDDAWRRVALRTTRAGVRLRHREGYLRGSLSNAQDWPENAWHALTLQSLGSSSVRLAARGSREANKLSISLRVVPRDLRFLTRHGRTFADIEIGMVEMTEAGATIVQKQPAEITLTDPDGIDSEVIELALSWEVNAGTSSIRLVVRDKSTDRYGTLDLPLSP